MTTRDEDEIRKESKPVKCSDIPTSTWPAGYKGGGGTLDPHSVQAMAGKAPRRFRQGYHTPKPIVR